jgi:hypothetical protein
MVERPQGVFVNQQQLFYFRDTYFKSFLPDNLTGIVKTLLPPKPVVESHARNKESRLRVFGRWKHPANTGWVPNRRKKMGCSRDPILNGKRQAKPEELGLKKQDEQVAERW